MTQIQHDVLKRPWGVYQPPPLPHTARAAFAPRPNPAHIQPSALFDFTPPAFADGLRVSVLQDQLAEALALIAPLAPEKRYRIPVLWNALMQTESGRLALTTTNLAGHVSVFITARVDRAGAITVPAKLMKEYAAQLSPERVDLRMDTPLQTVHTFCGCNHGRIKGIAASEFPPIPTVTGDTRDFTFDAVALNKALKPVFAALVHRHDGLISIISDGHTLTIDAGTRWHSIPAELPEFRTGIDPDVLKVAVNAFAATSGHYSGRKWIADPAECLFTLGEKDICIESNTARMTTQRG